MTRNLPVALIIMDGFGLAEDGPGNAISLARTPHLDILFGRWPTTQISASGLSVGLPEGQMGNSEVGHLNMGAGRVVYQELTRISKAIEQGAFGDNPVLIEAIDAAVADDKAVHLLGLVSDGGVHSHQEHLYALVRMAAERGANKVYVHAFLDGRDVPPQSGAGYVRALVSQLKQIGIGEVATVMGRYYAMDRDNRWERVEKAWRAMALGEGLECTDPVVAIEESYDSNVTDEFVVPVVVERDGAPTGRFEDGDAAIFFNFRPDRAREITRALVDPDFAEFEREKSPSLRFVCLTEYDPTIPAPVAFPKEFPCCTLADVVAREGLTQLHIAETEKYAHVTFFFNGGQESAKEGETRILVPSPKVPTYDMQPEMSEPEVAERLVEAIAGDAADVYIVNFANCDMVGHTGVLDAAVMAVEAVDEGVGRVVAAIREKGGTVLITADHGNAECMVAEDGETPFTAHTLSKVPLCLVAEGVSDLAENGILADVAPTLTALVGIESPPEWTGRSLLVY